MVDRGWIIQGYNLGAGMFLEELAWLWRCCCCSCTN